MSIRTRLIITFSVCLSLAYGSIAFTVFSSNRKTAEERFNALAASHLERVEERIRTFLEPGDVAAQYLAGLDLVRNSRGKLTSYLDTAERITLWYASHPPYEQRIYDEFIRVFNSNPNFDLVFMANNDGQYAQAPEGRYKNPGYDPRLRPWYLEALKSGDEITVSSPYIASDSDKSIISIVVRTYDPEGKPLGFLGIDYNLESLLHDLETRRILNTGYFGTVDRNGRILTNGLYPELVTAKREDYPPMFDSIVNDPDGVFIGPGVGGTRRHIVTHSIRDIGWKLLVIFEESEVLASSYGLLRTILLTSGIVFLIAFGVLSLLARSIVRPMEELVEAADIISSGEYDKRERVRESVLKRLTITGQGESRKLANALHSMLTILEDRVEAARAANAAKGEFLSKMSHEMRTPLNAIIGLSELELGSEKLPENSCSNVEKIYVSGMNLLGIINDILDISKIDSGNFTLVPVEYEVPSLINDTMVLNTVRIGSKAIEFSLHIDETLPLRLIGDELRIKQIFNNLLSNAFKYTREGQVNWYLSGERQGKDVWLSCSIQDTGIGIREDDIKWLFADYNRLDPEGNRKVEGTGLGLSITKNLVERMGGTISVESEYGKGSTFSFRIRQEYVDDMVIDSEVRKNLTNFQYTADRRSKRGNMVRANLSYAHVLVVDDVSFNLDVARGMLKPYGMTVDCVDSGQKAIDLIREGSREGHKKYNAIFMDHMMPEMDGIEAVRIIRNEIEGEYAKTIPIIALTANAIAGNEAFFLQNGFQAFLSKPIDIIRLDAVINRYVRDKKKELPLSENQPKLPEELPAKPRESSLFEGKSLPGIDIGTGLRRFENNEETYLGILKAYFAHIKTLPEEIRTSIAELPENIKNYEILMHSLKGTSNTAGTGAIGKMAEEQEHAAASGDLEFIRSRSSALIGELEKIIPPLNDFLEELKGLNPKPVKPAPDPALLAQVLNASINYDMEQLDAAIAELERYEYKSQSELIEWLRKQIDKSELESIKERLSYGS